MEAKPEQARCQTRDGSNWRNARRNACGARKWESGAEVVEVEMAGQPGIRWVQREAEVEWNGGENKGRELKPKRGRQEGRPAGGGGPGAQESEIEWWNGGPSGLPGPGARTARPE